MNKPIQAYRPRVTTRSMLVSSAAFILLALLPAVVQAQGTPPTLTKTFVPTSIPVNGTSVITFVASNVGATTLTGVTFTDTFPAGMIVATPNNINGFCTGGSAGVASGASGGNTTSLFNTTLLAGTLCQYSITVQGTTAGVLNNVTSTITSNEAAAGAAASATLTVVGPPTLTKTFGAASIARLGSTSLTFVVTNPNTTTALTGVDFVDNLPSAIVVANPNGLAGSCGAGTITAVAGSGSVTLSGGTLAASASCTFSVNVTGINVGTAANTTGAVTSVEGGTGGTAAATLNVGPAPTQVIPTLSQWMLALLGLLLAVSAWLYWRRPNR